MKKIIWFIVPVCVVLLLFGCAKKETPVPQIQVTAAETAVESSAERVAWDGEEFETSEGFLKLAEADKALEAVNGDTIRMTFPDGLPDSYTLFDTLLNEDGTPKYTTKDGAEKALENEITADASEDSLSFVLEANPYIALSSAMPKDGDRIYRGFRLRAVWGENICDYYFILSTDYKI